MNMKTGTLIRCCAAVLTAAGCFCSMSPVAGGNSSQTGNNGMVVAASMNAGQGSVLGKTVANAQVSIYAAEYLPWCDSGFADTTIADGSGDFSFAGLDSGLYNIMTKDFVENKAGFISGIAIVPAALYADTLDSLEQPGFLTGVLATDATGDTLLLWSVVFIAGTPFSAATDNRGKFLLGEIPAGRYALQIKRNFKLFAGALTTVTGLDAPADSIGILIEAGRISTLTR